MLTDFGGLREFIFISAYEESTSSSPQPSAPPEYQTSHCRWSHERRGITPGPQPQVKKHMTTTLVLFAHVWAQQASRNSREKHMPPPPPMLRPNSRKCCYQDTSHPSLKTVFSLTSLYSGQSVKSKNGERGGGFWRRQLSLCPGWAISSSGPAGHVGLFRCCLGVLKIIWGDAIFKSVAWKKNLRQTPADSLKWTHEGLYSWLRTACCDCDSPPRPQLRCRSASGLLK